MSAITVGGELVHYEVLGRGRPVILVHGWVGAWRYWIPTMQQLHMKYRVYALDLFGFGDSGKEPGMFPIAKQVDMLDEFMDQLAIPRAAFIGHGLGAMVVAEFALKHQKRRVPRALLVSLPLIEFENLESRHPVILSRNFSNSGGYSDDPDRTLVSRSPEATIPSAGMMRAALIERAAARNRQAGSIPSPIQTSNDDKEEEKSDLEQKTHEFKERLARDPLDLLDVCFRSNEVEYGKLKSDVEKTHKDVVRITTEKFDAGKMLDTVRQMEMPTVLVHGENDEIILAPDIAKSIPLSGFSKGSDGKRIYDDGAGTKLIIDEDRLIYKDDSGKVLYEDQLIIEDDAGKVISDDQRINDGDENKMMVIVDTPVLIYIKAEHKAKAPIALQDVRHFPMLEYERFGRLVNDFLETADINDVKTRNRWRRRSR